MCCHLTYKEGPRTIEIRNFTNVRSAVKHANEQGIENYYLKVEADQYEC